MLCFTGLERQGDFIWSPYGPSSFVCYSLLRFISLWFHIWFCSRMFSTNYNLFYQVIFFIYCLEFRWRSSAQKHQTFPEASLSSLSKEKHEMAPVSARRKVMRKSVPAEIPSSLPGEREIRGLGGGAVLLKSMDYSYAPQASSGLSWDRKWWNQFSHELGGGVVMCIMGFLSQLDAQGGWERESRGEVGHGEVPALPPNAFPCSSEAMIVSRPISSPKNQSLLLMVMASMMNTNFLHSWPFMTMVTGQKDGPSTYYIPCSLIKLGLKYQVDSSNFHPKK